MCFSIVLLLAIVITSNSNCGKGERYRRRGRYQRRLRGYRTSKRAVGMNACLCSGQFSKGANQFQFFNRTRSPKNGYKPLHLCSKLETEFQVLHPRKATSRITGLKEGTTKAVRKKEYFLAPKLTKGKCPECRTQTPVRVCVLWKY